jgi:ribosomal protein S18 acetylase RimI-like enzyme
LSAVVTQRPAPETQARLVYVDSGELVAHARTLFQEYEQAIGVDLCFQGFAQELATLPKPYVAPDGRLLLALVDAAVAGCAALRRIGDGVAELKRLYVRPAFRGRGLGTRLVATLLDDARTIGYRAVRLDTLPTMSEAIALYRTLGFTEIAPYTANPVPGALFMERRL